MSIDHGSGGVLSTEIAIAMPSQIQSGSNSGFGDSRADAAWTMLAEADAVDGG